MILHCFKKDHVMYGLYTQQFKKANFMKIDQITKEDIRFFREPVVFFRGATGSRFPGCPITTLLPRKPPPTD